MEKEGGPKRTGKDVGVVIRKVTAAGSILAQVLIPISYHNMYNIYRQKFGV
jgi:hypothetical protein